MVRTLRIALVLAAVAASASGCAWREPLRDWGAYWDGVVEQYQWPTWWPVREFQNDGVFVEQERFREFPRDQVFSREIAQVKRPRPSEETSPVMRLRGLYQYMADAARFVDCNTDRAYPVLMEGDHAVRLERAYLDARPTPGAPVQVSLDGRLVLRPKVDGDGLQQFVKVETFDRIVGPADCSLPRS